MKFVRTKPEYTERKDKEQKTNVFLGLYRPKKVALYFMSKFCGTYLQFSNPSLIREKFI